MIVGAQPLIVAGLWLTGGADSYLGPMLVLPMLYVAYFFPLRYAVPLGALEIATYASPLLTSAGPDHLLVHRALAYAVGYAGLVAIIQFLKRRLVDAERVQHQMARGGPAHRAREPARVRRGARPRVRRAASPCCSSTSTSSSRSTTASATRRATACSASWPPTPRPRSARATAWPASAATSSRWSPRRRPGAAGGSPTRCVTPAAAVDAGDGPVSLTVAAAVYPTDGDDRAALLRALDRRLHDIKDAARVYPHPLEVDHAAPCPRRGGRCRGD